MNYSYYEDPLISYDKVVNKRKITHLHTHNNYELYYLVKGKTKYFVGDETYVLDEGNLIFIAPQNLHSCDSEDVLYNERILLSIPPSYIDERISPVINELKNSRIIFVTDENLYKIEELLNRIYKEYTGERNYKGEMLRLYIYELLIFLVRHKKSYILASSQVDDLMNEIADYIRQNFSSRLTLGSLSRRFGISKEHLSRRFKSVMGIGFNDFVTYVRITNAERLLRGRELPITEIASLCGFSDSNYFASVFKKLKGITPYKYSKQSSKSIF